MKLTLAALALLALAACSSGGYADHRFTSTAELQQVLAKAGWHCLDGYDEATTKADLDKYGASSLPCDDGAAVIWRSDVARQDSESKPWNALKPGQTRIVGINWTVDAPNDRANDLQKVLKGKVA